MWIFAKAGFLSIVQHRDRPDMLMVRARVKGDIEHFFPNAKVIRMEDADYLYRTTLPRQEVADRVRGAVIDIRSGFKDSVTDKRRVRYYFEVWDTLYQMQEAFKATEPKPHISLAWPASKSRRETLPPTTKR